MNMFWQTLNSLKKGSLYRTFFQLSTSSNLMSPTRSLCLIHCINGKIALLKMDLSIILFFTNELFLKFHNNINCV